MRVPVPKLDTKIRQLAQTKIDGKTKPPGSLGGLENIAQALCFIQQRIDPIILSPTVVVFAGDHGISQEGVSAYPKEVTQQMVLNFLGGGAAINALSKSAGMAFQIVDVGVDADFKGAPGLIDRKVARGTQSFLGGNAMGESQMVEAMNAGKEVVADLGEAGCNTIAFGEMGIGNTSSASILMSVLTGENIEACVGRGTGLIDSQVSHKIEILKQAIAHHGDSVSDPLRALAAFGGFEIAAMCGAYLEAARRNMIILVDGFITCAALLVASKISPPVLERCLFSHIGEEKGHRLLVAHLGGTGILDMGLRLGEGTGAALAFPLVKAAEAFLRDMASFESAGVSGKE